MVYHAGLSQPQSGAAIMFHTADLTVSAHQTQRSKLILLRAEKLRANRKPAAFCS